MTLAPLPASSGSWRWSPSSACSRASSFSVGWSGGSMSISSVHAVSARSDRDSASLPLVAFEGVSKRFQRHGGQSLLRHFLQQVFERDGAEPFYALRDVTFSLMRGESLAVIGRNGAGKSTLLSLVAGLCQPEKGSVA